MSNQLASLIILSSFISLYIAWLILVLPNNLYPRFFPLLIFLLPIALWRRNVLNRKRFTKLEKKLRSSSTDYRILKVRALVHWHSTRTVPFRFNHPITLKHPNEETKATLLISEGWVILQLTTRHFWGTRIHRPLVAHYRKDLPPSNPSLKPNAVLSVGHDGLTFYPKYTYPNLSEVEILDF